MKKIFTILILFSLTMSVRAAVVDSGYCGGEGNGTNLSWELTDDGTLTISGEGKMADYFAYNNAVPWKFYREDILNVLINDGVTTIGNVAFSGCSSLKGVKIPEGVTSIGEVAFSNCSSLESIEVPASLTSIGGNAFNQCKLLTIIKIPEGLISIGECAFFSCLSLERVALPESVMSIGGGAFYNCRSLTSIEMPGSVTSIGNAAFISCISLESIVIPESVTSIGERAFYGCSSLESIVIPEGVTSIGERAFYDCSSLENIISNNPTPPSCIGLSCFSAVDSDIPVYVPAASIERYRNAEGWDYFTNFLPLEELGGDEPGGSAVTETEAATVSKITAYNGRIYCDEDFRIVNLAGRDVTAMNGKLQGTYIVVSGDKAVKVSVD